MRALLWGLVTLASCTNDSPPPNHPPAIGDSVPVVEFVTYDGSVKSLRELAGNRIAVVAWYPRAFTGG